MSQYTVREINIGPGGDVETLTGNLGGPVPPAAGNINIVGLSQRTESTTSANDGGGILIIGDPGTNTLTASYESFGSLNVFVGEAAGNNNLTGSANVGIGPFALNSLTTGSNNIALGYLAMQPSQNASNNIAIGPLALNVCFSGQANVAIGSSCLQSLGNGGEPTNNNTALGALTFQTLITGTDNIGIGFLTGSAYQGAESSNILIANSGVQGESNVAHIGTTGSGAGQITNMILGGSNLAFGAVTFTSSGGSVFLTDQVGYTTSNDNTFWARFSGGCNFNTFQVFSDGSTLQPSGQFVHITSVTTVTYTALTTDYILACNRAGVIAIALPSATGSGQTYRIKDVSGAAGANNITVTAVGSTFDGAANSIINTNYGSMDYVDTASGIWSIF